MTAASNCGRPVRIAARRPALLALLAVLGLVVVMLRAVPAVAHANLVRSDPAAGAVLTTAPAQVQLWFSEQPDPHFSDVQVINANGRRVDHADMRPAPSDPLSLIAGVSSPLPDGLYTIVWKTVSAVDGHVVNGSVPFYVGQPPAGVYVPVGAQSGPASSGGLPGPGAVFDRWLGLLSGVLLAGGFAFWPLVLLPALRVIGTDTPGEHAAARPDARRRWLRVLAAAWTVLAVAAIVALVQQVLTVSGKDLVPALGAPLHTELLHTRYGHVWWLRAGATLAAGVVLLALVRSATRRSSRALGMAGFAAVEGVFLAYSLNSHGAALTSQSGLATAADFVHLSATGLWLGGLAQFVITVPGALRGLEAERRLRFLAAAVPRFSTLALGSVAVIVATGVYQAVRQLPGWDAFTDTGYGRTLLLKLLLFLPVLALAALNLLVIKPALRRAACGEVGTSGRFARLLRPVRLERRFLLAVGGESLLGLAILGVVGLLVNQPPVRTPAPFVPGVQLTAKAPGVTVKLTVDPGGLGLNRFTAVVSDHGKPPPSGTQLVLRLTYQDADRGTSELPTQPQGNGVYTAQSSDLSAYGRWQIIALVQPPAADEVRTDFSFTLSQGGSSGAGRTAGAATSVQRGRQLYAANCARCHGTSGHGDGPDGKQLDPPPADLIVHVPQHSDQQLLGFITNGIPTTAMPAFGNTLSADERQAILNYLRQLAGPPATATPAP
jgi:copper transport protein